MVRISWVAQLPSMLPNLVKNARSVISEIEIAAAADETATR